MPYITCHKGKIHSRYEQSDHVKQEIRLQKQNFPISESLYTCTKINQKGVLVNNSFDNSFGPGGVFIMCILVFIGILIFTVLYKTQSR